MAGCDDAAASALLSKDGNSVGKALFRRSQYHPVADFNRERAWRDHLGVIPAMLERGDRIVDELMTVAGVHQVIEFRQLTDQSAHKCFTR